MEKETRAESLLHFRSKPCIFLIDHQLGMASWFYGEDLVLGFEQQYFVAVFLKKIFSTRAKMVYHSLHFRIQAIQF